MERNLELSVKLKTAVAGLAEIQKLIGEIDDVGGATELAAGRSRALSDEIQKLEDSQRLIDTFRDIRVEVNKAGEELGNAQAEAQRLARELANTKQSTNQLQKDFDSAGAATARFKDEQAQLSVELKNLKKSQALVDQFRDLRLEVNKTGEELEAAQKKAQLLGRELSNTEKPTKKLQGDFDKARKSVVRLKDEQIAQIQALQHSRAELDKVGISSRKLNDAQANIRRSVQSTNEEIQQLAVRLKEAQAESKRLAKELSNTSQPTKKLERDFDRARKTVQRLKDEQLEHIQALQRTRGELDKAGISSKNLNAAQASVRDSMARTTNEVKNLGAQLRYTRGQAAKKLADPTDNLEKGARSAGNEVESLGAKVKRAATIAIGSAAAFFGIREAIRGITGIVKVGGDFEILQDRLESLTGSAEAGEEAFAWIKDFTENTPFQLNEVTDAFVRAKAFGLDPMNGTLKAVADQAAKTGGGIESLNGIVSALGQAYSKGKLQTEEMLQLIERGVPAWDLLAEATGRSTSELQNMASAGQLGRREIQLLIDQLGKSGAGAAEKQMSKLQGLVSNLKDTFVEFLNDVNNEGLLEYVKAQIKDLASAFEEMRANGELQEWAKRISDSIISFAEATKATVFAITEHIGVITLLGKAYAALKLSNLVTDIRNVAGAMVGPLATGAGAATTATQFLSRAMRAIPWLAVFNAAQNTAEAYFKMRDAQRELAKSEALGAEVKERALEQLREFNEQTGLNAQTTKEAIRLQDEGIVILDEYTGKWRLASQEISAGEKAQRAQAAAAKSARADLLALDATVSNLTGKFKESRKGGEDLDKSIAEMADSALNSGAGGISELSLAIERLAIEGHATRSELSEGLGSYLEGLSKEKYTAFGEAVSDELKRIKESADKTTNRLSFMQTVLEASLVAAAKRAGVDIGQVLKGIDKEAQASIGAFTKLAEEISRSALAGDEADKLLSAGLANTLKNLDSTEEIEATILALDALGAAGVLSSGQVAELTAQLKTRAQEIKAALDEAEKKARALGDTGKTAGNDIAGSMDDAAESVRELGNVATEAERKIGDTATRARGIAGGLAAFYNTVTANLVSLSQKAHDAFQGATGGQAALDSIDDYRSKLEGVEKQIQSMTRAVYVDRTGIINWMRGTSLAAATVEADFYRQKIALDDLVRSIETGGLAGRNMTDSIDSLGRRFDLLDDQDLSRLQGAIQRVQGEVLGLNDSLQDTISSLKQELASLQGDNEQLEQLRYQEQRLELETQLQRARGLGDREAIAAAQEALKLSQQAYNLRVAAAKQRSDEEKARAAADAAALERQRQQDEVNQREQQSQKARDTRQEQIGQSIKLVLPKGGEAKLSGDSDDINKLLDFLADAGLRTTAQ